MTTSRRSTPGNRPTEDFYRELLDSVSDGVYLVDSGRRITVWSRGAERLTGFAEAEVLGRRCSDSILNHVDETGRPLCGRRCPLAATLRDGQAREVHAFMHHRDGHLTPVHLRANVMRDADGRLVGAAETFSDDSLLHATRTLADELRAEAETDPLTRLANRRALDLELERRVLRWERLGEPFSLLFADIDRFKSVNDELGHETGDQVLRVVGDTLAAAGRRDDFTARLGGEEFVVVVGATSTAGVAAERRRALVARARVPGHRRRITVSVGAATVRQGDTVESILQRADQLMYAAKAAGRNRVCSES
jgi:diguanylate cyclase (GGDEF)-like protein/PAS domain S-box-containing protein